jgi:hypothetical protein
MSFIIDPPLLVATGAAVESKISDSETKDKLEKLTLIVFIATSLSLYFELPWVKWMWKMLGSQSGRDWMINSGILRLETKKLSLTSHLKWLSIFLTYPLWFKLGRRLARAKS